MPLLYNYLMTRAVNTQNTLLAAKGGAFAPPLSSLNPPLGIKQISRKLVPLQAVVSGIKKKLSQNYLAHMSAPAPINCSISCLLLAMQA